MGGWWHIEKGRGRAMIFPDDIKYVGVCGKKPNRSEKVYFLTHYLIEHNNDEFTVYAVETEGEGAMREVVHVQLIAAPEQIVSYESEVDVHNRADLVELADMLCSDEVNTVIFRGIDKHLTFVHEPDITQILSIEVYDVVPPHPSVLLHWLTKLKEAGAFNDVMVKFVPRLVNLKDFEHLNAVFPCSSSGLSPPYLDSDTFDGSVLLVGCNTGVQVMHSMYPDVSCELESFCPFSTRLYTPSGPFIARCCRRERCGLVSINGQKGYIVHWGVHQSELIKAVHALAREFECSK